MPSKIIDPFTDEEIEFIDPFAEPEDKGGMGKAFGAGVDKLQELGYRAVKGFAESGENPGDYEAGTVSRSVAETIGQGGSLSQFAVEGIERNIEEQRTYEPTVKSYKEVDSIGAAASYTGELVAGSLPYMAGAMTPVGAATMAGGLSEEAYDKQPEDEKNALRAVTSGTGQMALERLGIKASLGQIGKDILKDGVVETAKRLGKGELVDAVKDGSFAKRILKGSLWEGVTESGQEALAQWGAGKDISEINGLDEAFVGGVVVGGVIRTSSEGAQRVFSWQEKSAPIAKNGIDELIKQGAHQDDAINQVKAQLIESGVKQGLSETESAAAAARTMKMEYGIEHDLFQPIANDVASRRAAMNERLNQQRIDGGIGDVQQSLSSDGAPTSDELVQQQMENNDPAFFEQLDKLDANESTAEEAPLSVSERRELMELRLDKQRIEGGVGDVQQSLAKDEELSTPEQLINQASNEIGPVPSENFAKVEGKEIDPFTQEEIEVDIAPSVKERRELLNEKLNQQRIESGIGEVQEALKEKQKTASQEAVVVSEPQDVDDTNVVDIAKNTELPEVKTIDEAAHEAATSPNNDLPEPSQAQKEAGNYKMGRIKHSGLDIGIENPEGSDRSGIDNDGNKWSVKMKHHYGDITGTKGADGDAVDVFVNPTTTDGDYVFIVNQVDPTLGKFDEHKVMLGYDSVAKAKSAYFSNYDFSWRNHNHKVVSATKDEFNDWLKNGDTTKPFALTEKPSTENVDKSVAESLQEKLNAAKSLDEVESIGNEITKADKSKLLTDNEASKLDTSYILSRKKLGFVPNWQEKKSEPKSKVEKINDFGEVLHGANKHNYTYNEKLNDDVDVKAVPLSKSFPQPDYEKLAAEGANPRALAFIAQLRGEIKPKPRQAGKVERWSHQVSSARHNAKKLLEMGEGGSDIMIAKLKKSETGYDQYLKYLPHVLDIAKEIPAKNIKALGHFKLTHSFYNLYHGEKDVHKWVVTNTNEKGGFGRMGNMTHFDTSEEAVAFVKSQVTDENIINGKKLAKFDVWTERGNKGTVFVGKKLAARKFVELKQFPNFKEARRYINENNAELVLLLKNKKKIKAHRRADNNPRIGADHRKGVDATAEMFDKAFGFRGVQFGNWVEGHKRQNDLNYAYDGLMDLAGILDLPPKALSLNGDLGLAFGARGKGGDNAAMAHYEPGSVVINLTKKMGAGSLAHEWWHALDNYFSKMDSSKLGNVDKSYITEGGRRLGVRKDGKHQRAVSEDFGVRQEVYDAFTSLTKAINTETKLAERSAELDKLRGKDYWGTVIEMTARSFERYVIDKLASQGFESDYLANIVKESSTEASKEISDYPYPLAVEMDVVNKAYDGIFDILQTKETDQGTALFSADKSIRVSPNKVSLKEAQNIVNEFQQEYNGNVPLEFRVVEKQEHLYGPENTIEKVGLIKGSYHPKTGVLGIASSNMQNRADGQATLRHEILGHYGLNTFKPEDKKVILQRVINSKKHSSLKAVWAKVDENYPELDNMGKAEEVFAILAEKPPADTSFWGGLVVLVRKALRAIGIGKGSISKAEIESYIKDIAKSIKSGEARQQTFPKSDQEQFRRENSPINDTQININDESRKDAVIRIMQDKFRRLKLIQRELSVNDSNDAYMAEEAFHGKVGEDLRELENKHTDKIADTMAKHDLSQDEVDLYLIAKHASERNAYIDTINPELNGAGSGMSNDAAQAILDKSLLENKRLALEMVANHVYAMLKQNREMMADFGLEAQDAIDTWQQQYQFYVPLKGYAAEDGATDGKGKKFGTGKGFNIKGRETIKAMGRRSLAESPLLHTISDTTQAVIRARKNEVGNTFLKLVNDNPDPELWEIFTAENPDTKRGELPDGTIGVVNMTAFEMKAGEEYFKTKVDGVEQFVKIKDPLLARAMGNLGVDESNMLTQNLGKVTRLLSALVTTWNPEFMLTNFTRDVQAAVANLIAETQVKDGKAVNTEGLVKEMLKSLPKAMTVLKHGFRDNDFSDADWGPYLKEFLESGSKTGWVNQQDIDGLANELKGSISRASNTKTGKAKRAGKAVADFVSDYNDIVENASRFSVYYHARKQGVTVKKASSLAKNLTINFNRKGEVGNTLNAIYMFANASMQGTANMLRALATPKDRSKSMWDPQFYNLSQKLAVSSIGATVLMANAMRELGGDDEDGVPFYDKIPDFVKATNFIIMTGGKDYVAIPMPYGYNVLAAVGHSIDGVIQGKSIGKQAANLLMSSVSAFSPIGMQESESVEKAAIRTLSPTVLKPFAEMATNENFFGGNIFPEQRGYGAEKSDANLGGKYTWEWTKNFTTWLNNATGGSEFRSGKIDIAPQTIDHLVKFMGGGVLQFGMRWQNLAVKAANGKEVVTNDIPFLRRFYKQLNPKATIGEFYDAKNTLNKIKADFASLRGGDRASYMRENKDALMLQQYASGIEKALRALNKQKRLVEASQLSEKVKEERIRLIEDRKIEFALRFSTKKNKLGLKYLN